MATPDFQHAPIQPLGGQQQQNQHQGYVPPPQQHQQHNQQGGKKPKQGFAAKIGNAASRLEASANHVSATTIHKLEVSTGTINAVTLLLDQHQEYEGILANIMSTKDPATRRKLLMQVVMYIDAHNRIEEELFLPAIRQYAPEGSPYKMLRDDHDEIKEVMSRLMQCDVANPVFDGLMQQFTSAVVRHFNEEQVTVMPLAKRVLDKKLQKTLGKQMNHRYVEILKMNKPRKMYGERDAG